jgi:tetratricopeptide (TPR) repeat protein
MDHSAGARDPLFVGRADELALLTTALDGATAARGRLLLVAGEPGIGKTRLVDEFADSARRRGAQVLAGRCWEHDGAPAYWPWVQVLRVALRGRDAAALRATLGVGAAEIEQLVPVAALPLPDSERRPSIDAAQARFRLFDSVLSILHQLAGAAPVVVTLDDLQGADLPSLLLLEFLAASVSGLPVLIVGTYRTTGVAAERPLVQRLPELLRAAGTQRLELHGLSREEVAAYALRWFGRHTSVRLIDLLYQQSDGNPFFLGELARGIGHDPPAPGGAVPDAGRLPASVREVINCHLVRLSADCRRVLRVASVLGREFNIDALARITEGSAGRPAAMLDEAVATQVLHDEGGGRYSFAHQLMRDALHGELALDDRARLHGRAGEALAGYADANEHLAEIAYHLVEATQAGGDPIRAVDYARRAGDASLRLLAFEEAQRLYQLALDTLDRHDPGDTHRRAELLLALGDARYHTGQIEPARELFLRAADCARSLGDRELLARAALGYGGEHSFPESGARDEVHVALLEDALAAWGDDDHPLHAYLLGHLAISLYFSDAAPRRAQLCERSLTMARRLADPRALAQVLLMTHAATWGPNPHERLTIANELLKLAHQLTDRVLAYWGHHWRFCDVLDLGDHVAVDAELAACRALADELRQPYQIAWAQVFACTLATLEGRFEAGERAAAAIVARGQWLGRGVEAVFGIELFVLRHLQGRHAELIEPIRAMVALNPGIPAMRAGLAVLYAESGRHAEARAEVGPLIDTIDEIPWGLNVIPMLGHLAHVCALVGDTRGAATVHERLRAYDGLSFTIGNGVGYLGTVSHYLGMIEAVMGRDDDACRHFEDALSVYERMRARPWIALAQADYGMLLLRAADTGARRRALGLLATALETAHALGMAGVEKKVAGSLALVPGSVERLAPAGISSPPRAASHEAPGANSFCCEGAYWTLAYGGRVVRLKEMKGLHYIVQLLRHPGQAIHVLDLVVVEPGDERSGGAPAAHARGLDGPANVEYQRRLADLHDALAEAERHHDLGRLHRVQAEIDGLGEQLPGAVGIGGGKRTGGAPVERARLAVTKRIKDAIARIRTAHPELGQHLATSISTGYACIYHPEQHAEWRL